MDTLYWIAIFVSAIYILVKSADYFVVAAEKIGLNLGISPFVIGVTIVALGTSLPELVASIIATYNGHSEIVLGNVVGSNISNILLILGTSFVLQKRITLDFKKQKWDYFFFLFSALAVSYFVFDENFTLLEAIACLILLLAYILYTILYSSSPTDKKEKRTLTTSRPFKWTPVFIVLLSSILIFISAHYTIYSVEKLALIWNIGTEIIALTAVALGTSLPELVVSIVATKKGLTNMVIGNILGSNIFNTLAVMSIPFFISRQLDIPSKIVGFGLPIMLLATCLFFILGLRKKAHFINGFTFLLLYLLFLIGVCLDIRIM